ncbi:MAG: hypothetical protein I3274_07360 [Candidatus Moeniiplasma glomeromycotorum]|nr:hypothetical protein [Candidatus Moeniiplasma glomeromycotorum]MCE8168166.1 hypothetical protein [Candidatus Moeniiplasma glomeromycotorum]
MTHIKNTKNPIPQIEEQQFLYEEQQTEQQVIQKILNDFKQPIPTNFIKLKVEEGNYQLSTSSKWKDKPVSERFGFYLEEEEEKWVQIDIPHNLVEKLEIEKGGDITYPFYLTIDVLEKKLIRGAYTIENEEEVFIDKPVSEKNVERELVKRLEELEILRKQVKELENLKHEKAKLEEKSINLENKVQEEQEKNDRLDEKIWEERRVKKELQKELKELKNVKRSWEDFHKWLLTNITYDRKIYPSWLHMKSEFKDGYPLLNSNYDSGTLTLYGSLLESIRRASGFARSTDKQMFRVFILKKEYKDDAKFLDLVSGFDYGNPFGYTSLSDEKVKKTVEEVDKLLKKYRQATTSQTTTE